MLLHVKKKKECQHGTTIKNAILISCGEPPSKSSKRVKSPSDYIYEAYMNQMNSVVRHESHFQDILSIYKYSKN